MGQRERHIDRLALINGKQSQVVDGYSNAHITALAALGGEAKLIFIAPDMEVGTELLELADDIGKVV